MIILNLRIVDIWDDLCTFKQCLVESDILEMEQITQVTQVVNK